MAWFDFRLASGLGIGRLRLSELIGEGAFAQVWADSETDVAGRSLAVKLFVGTRDQVDAGIAEAKKLDLLRGSGYVVDYITSVPFRVLPEQYAALVFDGLDRNPSPSAVVDRLRDLAMQEIGGVEINARDLTIPVLSVGMVSEHEIHDSEDPGTYTFGLATVLERADSTLEQLRLSSSNGRISSEELIPIARDLAKGLVDLHGHFPHLDVKADNALIFERGYAPRRAKLADLGMAADHYDQWTAVRTGSGLDHPRFHAVPESISGRRSGDIWCFGRMLHEALTGHQPLLLAGEVAGEGFRKQHLVPPATFEGELLELHPGSAPGDHTGPWVHAGMGPLTELIRWSLAADPTNTAEELLARLEAMPVTALEVTPLELVEASIDTAVPFDVARRIVTPHNRDIDPDRVVRGWVKLRHLNLPVLPVPSYPAPTLKPLRVVGATAGESDPDLTTEVAETSDSARRKYEQRLAAAAGASLVRLLLVEDGSDYRLFAGQRGEAQLLELDPIGADQLPPFVAELAQRSPTLLADVAIDVARSLVDRATVVAEFQLVGLPRPRFLTLATLANQVNEPDGKFDPVGGAVVFTSSSSEVLVIPRAYAHGEQAPKRTIHPRWASVLAGAAENLIVAGNEVESAAGRDRFGESPANLARMRAALDSLSRLELDQIHGLVVRDLDRMDRSSADIEFDAATTRSALTRAAKPILKPIAVALNQGAHDAIGDTTFVGGKHQQPPRGRMTIVTPAGFPSWLYALLLEHLEGRPVCQTLREVSRAATSVRGWLPRQAVGDPLWHSLAIKTSNGSDVLLEQGAMPGEFGIARRTPQAHMTDGVRASIVEVVAEKVIDLVDLHIPIERPGPRGEVSIEIAVDYEANGKLVIEGEALDRGPVQVIDDLYAAILSRKTAQAGRLRPV